MYELVVIAVTSSLISNVVLSQFLGLCPFLGVSRKVDTAFGMGMALTFVLTIASLVCACLYQFVILPLDLEYLNTIIFILVIAMLVQFVEMVLKKFMPALYQALGIYLPLITTNCAVLGVAINNVSAGFKDHFVLKSTVTGLFTAIGFTIAIVLMAGIRENIIEGNDRI
ncbi:MAG: electron transport complex subunit RsxA, partial [Lachnospiraceae bacterium]|nr:electron transport complex subunit RsxA [Lachnospiraceae bacterium]